MIEQLRIRQLGVIEDAELELHPGFNVVTGETGAGKTMVVNGLGLLLGERADSTRVRAGGDRARIEGVLTISDPTLRDVVVDAGGDVDDDAIDSEPARVVLARVVSSEGRSRAHLGGAGVPVSLLADVGGALIAVHGQSDQLLLRSAAHQRDLVDRFAGEQLHKVGAAVSQAYTRWTELHHDLESRLSLTAERLTEAETLRYGLSLIDAVNPVLGEDQALAAESDRLGNAEMLRAAADDAHRALSGESVTADVDQDDERNVAALLATARQRLDAVSSHDEALARVAARLRDLQTESIDAAADLSRYASDLDTDAARLDAVEQRRAALADLTRRFGPGVDDVLRWAENARVRLDDLDSSDERIEQLQHEVAQAHSTLTQECQALSALRSQAAERVSELVTSELNLLAMPEASLVVSVLQRDDADGIPWPDGRHVAVDATGADHIEFLLQPHRDASPQPLRRIASGGELSRAMLAVEVVLADTADLGTYVFDEVDAGVGGAAAIEVGRRLARLARQRQVIVVTHLPQVAAFADRHFVVRKSEDGRVTASDVVALDDSDRTAELARMLAGLAQSEAGQAHADELLDLARRERVTVS